MTKLNNNLPVRQEKNGVFLLDFFGHSRGIQKRVADLLRTIPEMFSNITERGRFVRVELMGSLKGALETLESAFIQANLKLRIVAS